MNENHFIGEKMLQVFRFETLHFARTAKQRIRNGGHEIFNAFMTNVYHIQIDCV